MRLVVLGQGLRWGGHAMKIRLLRDYVEAQGDCREVLFLDAFDTLCTKWPASSILRERFRALNVGIIFNGESDLTPDPSLQSSWPRHLLRQPFPYLNSGLFFGRLETVRRMLSEVTEDMQQNFDGSSDVYDDQRLLQRWFLRNDGIATVDSMGLLFLSLHERQRDAVEERDVRVILLDNQPGALWGIQTHTSPLIIHGNGNGCLPFLRLIDAMETSEDKWPPIQHRTAAYPPPPFRTEEWRTCSWPWNSFS